MPGFDELAPDQKAVLQLLLKQGKSYDAIAGLLRLDPTNVRERALDALDALGADHPVGGELTSERQDELADHLLLQQTASERAATRRFLEDSAPGRTWARAVSAELRPIGGDGLPDIPAEPAEVAEALDEHTAARERQQTSSKLGGVLILLAVGAIIGLGVLLLVRGGDDAPAGDGGAAVTRGATGATGAGAEALPQQQINLNKPEGRSGKALGFAILADGGLALQAEGLPASDLYKVWLYNSKEDALPLGFAFYDRTTRTLQGQVQPPLPPEVTKFGTLIVTKEAGRDAVGPGTIVLRGPIKRG